MMPQRKQICIASDLEKRSKEKDHKDALRALYLIGGKQGIAAILKDNSPGPKQVDELNKDMIEKDYPDFMRCLIT